MTLLFSEGFDNCSSFKDVSGVFNVGANMLDDPRTIRPILTSGSVDSISPRNVGGSTLVLQSSYSLPTSGSIAVADLSLATRQQQEGSSTQVPVVLVGSGTLSSPFSFDKVGPYGDVLYFGTLPSFVINSNGNFNFTASELRGVQYSEYDYSLNFQIFRTRNSVKETMSTNENVVTFPVKSGDVISFTTPGPSFTGVLEPRFWTVETTGVFFPSVSIDLTKNLTSGVIGFGYMPLLPQSGYFGNGVENFTPIACLTDSQHRPHFFICNTNSGKIQLRKFSATNFINNSSLNEYYSYSIGSAQTDGSSQRYPRFLKSTTDPTLSIGGNDTNLTLIAESDVNKNTLVNNFWNYVELKFDMNAQDVALRINRKNTSTKNDLEFNGNNIISSTNPLTVLSGVFSGSGTYLTPYTSAISNSGIFKVHQEGRIFLNFQVTWNSSTSTSRNATFFQNGSAESISLPNQGFATFSSVDYKRNIPCVSGDVFGFTHGGFNLAPGATLQIKAYFTPTYSLSDQTDRTVRYLVLGTMWGQNINGVSPASNLQWKTLLDDIYVIDSSGLPNDFIGSVSCGRIPYDQLVNNTAASGSLISVSDVLSGSGGFTIPSGNGALFFDAINQEFNVKSSGFSTNNNNIVGIQIGMNGFSLNTEDYVGVGLDLPNNSGSHSYSPVILSRNSTEGGYARGPLYTTDPSGNKWTEQSVRSATFKLKTFSE